MNKDVDIQLKEHLEYLDDLISDSYANLRSFSEVDEGASPACEAILKVIDSLTQKRDTVLSLVLEHLSKMVEKEHQVTDTNLPPSVV